MGKHTRNLLLISLDTLRADVAYGGQLKNFEGLRTLGTSFQNTVSSSPITPVSHTSVFTGLQPFEHGVRHLLRDQLASSKATLAELMAHHEYRTAAIVSCPGLHRWYGLSRGFDHYDDEIPRLADGRDPLTVGDVKIRGTALKRAPLVVERARDWLKAHRHDSFFMFVHFFDTHWPYEAPEWYAPEGANPYEGEAHFVDHYLGVLIDTLREWRLLDETLVVVFSDHGEDLAGWYPNDHAGPELGHPEENGHGCLLFDATQMVPLVFVNPELVPGARHVTRQVRLVDIVPTISALLDLTDPDERAGASLVPFFMGDAPDRVAYCETYYRHEQAQAPTGVGGLGPLHAVRFANRYKVIHDIKNAEIHAYDLASDPHEQRPLIFPAGADLKLPE
jgi:arylsulfatase